MTKEQLAEQYAKQEWPYWSNSDQYKKCKSDFLAGWEECERQQWISIDDRLPEKNGQYLTCRHNGIIIVEHWFKGDSKFLWGSCYGVKFWRELPKPPQA